MTNSWAPNLDTRMELVNNIECFEYDSNYNDNNLGNNIVNVFDLVTFYFDEHRRKILVVYTYVDGTMQIAKEFLANYFLNSETILFTTSSCNFLRPVIKNYALQNSCVMEFKVNIDIDNINNTESSSYLSTEDLSTEDYGNEEEVYI
jgi:hypothetical protein